MESLENVSDKELETGIDKSLSNARELIAEGDILLEGNKFSRAYCLYQLATEEIGKSRLLFALIMNRQIGESINYKDTDREFTHHQTKSKSALVFEIIAFLVMYSNQHDKSADERKKRFQEAISNVENENDVQELNFFKNASLYVGLHDGSFVSPSEIINKEMAFGLRENALIRLEAGKMVLQNLLKDLPNIVTLVNQAKQVEPNHIDDHFFDTFFKD